MPERTQLRLTLLLAACTLLTAAPGYGRWRRHTALARAAYVRAVALRSKLESHPQDEREKADYKGAIREFRAVYYADPSYVKSPVAAQAVGDLYAEMGRVFSDPADFQEALKAYRFLMSQYPGSSMAQAASFQVGEIYFEALENPDQAAEAFHDFLRRYPRAPQASRARKRLKEIDQLAAERTKGKDSNPVASAGEKPSSGRLVKVTGIHDWVGPNYTRVVIAAKGPVKFTTLRLSNPDRIVFDLPNTFASHSLIGKEIRVKGEFLRSIRVGQFTPTVTRVVLDVEKINDYSVFPLPNPFRLIVDVHGPIPRLAEKSRASSPPTPAAAAPPRTRNQGEAAALQAEKQVERVAIPPKREALNRTRFPSHPQNEHASAPAPAPTAAPPSVPVSTKPASPTKNGEQTLTRALGLKVARIVIDPGHGGHDTGTIGPTGIEEKNVALDVALRLRKLIETRTDSQVIMTRTDDRFIPLEERTAIANEKDADLFISIHCNSIPRTLSRSRRVRGIETYYLNFTTDPEALELAARENATSQESVHQLQDLIKKIALSDTVEESQEFARDVQKALYRGLSKAGGGHISNRGVRKAPFVVLIGANMPSILTEISFLSDRRDDRLLTRPSYREKVAKALFKGIENYMTNLGTVRVAQRSR